MNIKILAFLIFTSFTITASGQWSHNPANPMLVCPTGGIGSDSIIRALNCGSYGYYIFWIDTRVGNGSSQVYGQLFDQDGYPQWGTGGKLFYGDTSVVVKDFDIVQNTAGDLLLAVINKKINNDTVFVVKFDSSGNSLWPQPVVAGTLIQLYVRINNIQIEENNTGAYISFIFDSFFSTADFRVTRIDSSGNSLWGLNGISASQGITNLNIGKMYPDNCCGVYVIMNYHGVSRIRDNGTLAWINLLVGPFLPDGTVDDSLNFVVLNGVQDIMATRFDTSGASTWIPGNKPVCIYPYQQYHPVIEYHNGYYYSSWIDMRLPTNSHHIYAQKIDVSGDPIWTTDGIWVTSEIFLPHFNMLLSDSGNMFISAKYSNVLTYSVFNLLQDYTLPWGAGGIPVGLYPYSPNGQNFILLNGDSGSVVTFWSNSNGVFGVKIDSHGQLVSLNETHDEFTNVYVYPNPSNGNFKITGLEEPIDEPVELIISSPEGKILFSSKCYESATQISLNLNEGFYLLYIQSSNSKAVQRIVITE